MGTLCYCLFPSSIRYELLNKTHVHPAKQLPANCVPMIPFIYNERNGQKKEEKKRKTHYYTFLTYFYFAKLSTDDFVCSFFASYSLVSSTAIITSDVFVTLGSFSFSYAFSSSTKITSYQRMTIVASIGLF